MSASHARDRVAGSLRRRWFISLRTLLVLLGVSALLVPLIWHLTKEVQQPREEQQTNEDEQRGGYWPGMMLFDRSGRPRIHIHSDGRRESGVPGLIHHLNHEDPGVRESAAGWLGAIGYAAKGALPALKKALEDPDGRVRAAATDAIKRIEADSARHKISEFKPHEKLDDSVFAKP